MIKLLLTAIICCLSFISTTTQSNFQACKDTGIPSNSYTIKTIVLDAGHGGKDDGCSGQHSKEKHLALDITLALGATIEAAYPSINVIYTRTKDVFIPLHKRASIANRSKADLFMSIHCNALGKKLAYISGTETFVMGTENSAHNSEVARRENEAILLEDNYQEQYQGFDPNSDEGHIFQNIFQNAHLDRSILLAEKVEKYVSRFTKRKSRGVRQAAFVVLRQTTMPSVLVETGFLTNSEDEQFLSSKSGQEQMASAIFKAFSEYKNEIEEEGFNLEKAMLREAAIAKKEENKLIASSMEEVPIVQQTVLVSGASQRATEPEREVKDQKMEKEKGKEKKGKEEKMKEQQETVVFEDKQPIKKKIKQITFTVQLAASAAPIDTNVPKWKLEGLKVRKEKTFHKYSVGEYSSYDKAATRRKELSYAGFKGAFVVAYLNGARISLTEARALLTQQ